MTRPSVPSMERLFLAPSKLAPHAVNLLCEDGVSGAVSVWCCRECGSLVFDLQRHTYFHDQFDLLIEASANGPSSLDTDGYPVHTPVPSCSDGSATPGGCCS